MNEYKLSEVQALVDEMDAGIGCGMTVGHNNSCTRGYECAACSNLRRFTEQLRKMYPDLAPSKIKEPKVYIVSEKDILTPQRFSDRARRNFTSRMIRGVED